MRKTLRKKQKHLRKTKRNYKKGGGNNNKNKKIIINTSKWTKENLQKYMNNEYQKYLNEIEEDEQNEQHIIKKSLNNSIQNFNEEQINWEIFPYKTNKPFLHPGNYAIVNKNNSLSTSGLATCSALFMNIGKKKFLVHLSAMTEIQNIVRDIEQTIKEQKVNPTSVIIYSGGGLEEFNSKVTINKAKEICKKLKIPENEIEIRDACFMDTIYV
jgi:hypothetical protein